MRLLHVDSNRPARVLWLAFIAVTGLLGLAGCSTPQGDPLGRSLTAYEGGQYQESLTLAQEASTNARTTKDSLESAYLAGMSSFRLGKHADAVKWLEEPARSDDRWMSGQANVTIGSSLLQLGRKSDAARAFVKAAERLDGDEAKKAHLAAANAFRELGDRNASDEQFRLANVTPPAAPSASPPASRPAANAGPASPPPAQASAGTASAAGPFVLQAGAFKDRAKADRRAEELRGKSRQAGMGEPRVVSKRGPDGGTVFVVQLGSFGDRRSADAALGRLGVSGVVVGRPVAG